MSLGTSRLRIRPLGALFAAFCLSGVAFGCGEAEPTPARAPDAAPTPVRASDAAPTQALASDASPAADDACAADAARLCPEAADASARTLCLLQNKLGLSAECREKTEKEYNPQFAAACAEESKSHCAQVRGGGLRLIACIASHRDELGDLCRAYLEVATAKPKTATPEPETPKP